LRKILPPTYLLIAIVVLVGLHFLVPGGRVLRFPWSLLGVAPLLAGAMLNLAADRSFKERNTTVKPFQTSTALVTEGVYAVSRHPMYLGFVLILLGVALLFGSLTPLLVPVAFTVLTEAVFIRTEEQMMAEQFGEEWDAYRRRTRRWL
jgi:protein-S-isoprenylcysteine O-methyltransferase Ste14